MTPTRMPLRADEEMGKKDDDHRPSDQARFLPSWRRASTRPRRIILAVIVLVLFYEFFKHMPTDLGPAAKRYNHAVAQSREDSIAKLVHSDIPDVSKPSVVSSVKEAEPNQEQETYDGKIKFYELARSLPSDKNSRKVASRAVVFVGSHLRSVSDLLPLACRMASEQLNYVHFVLAGKEEVSIEGIKEVNGIRDNECPLTWHDARPDHAAKSTDDRMERSVAAGLQIIATYIGPEVIITQGQDWENSFFWNGVEVFSRQDDTPHIALSTASRNIMWIALLDSTALGSWNNLRVEMVVHAPSQSSGSLIRLLQSLDAADYLGSTPSLTIELPQRVDPQLLEFLGNLDGLTQLTDRISIRRRIQPHEMDATESSLRTVEAFYPRDPNITHLLMLSPQTELAPSFYHYLKFVALNYKHSARARRVFSNMVGISLELPSSKPTSNGQSFTPPSMIGDDKEQHFASFLWQAPNSNAALYFGETWAEFHSFLSKRLSTPESGGVSQTKLISERYPAFMEYMLQMIRAKGYYLLYPAFPGTKSSSIATVHSELYQVPEEFWRRKPVNPSKDVFEDMDDPAHPLTGNFATGLGSVEPPLSRTSTIMPLLDLFSSGLPDLDNLPLLSYDGEKLTAAEYSKHTEEYFKQFRTQYGGCTSDRNMDDPVADLFCIQE